MNESNFWIAMAQVLPVLGVALVIELRQQRPRAARLGPLARTVVWSANALALLLIAVMTNVALAKLRDPAFLGDDGPLAVAAFAASGLASLMLLVNPSMRAFVVAMSAPVSRFSLTRWKLNRRLRKASLELRKIQEDGPLVAGQLANLADAMSRLESLGAPVRTLLDKAYADRVDAVERLRTVDLSSEGAAELSATIARLDMAIQLMTGALQLIEGLGAEVEESSAKVADVERRLREALTQAAVLGEDVNSVFAERGKAVEARLLAQGGADSSPSVGAEGSAPAE